MKRMIYLLIKSFGRRQSDRKRSRIINERALDISFGRFGYFLVLARAFKKVSHSLTMMSLEYNWPIEVLMEHHF